MADEDGQDPTEFSNEADLRSFYRDNPGPRGSDTARSTPKLNIRDYYLPDDEPYADEDPPIEEAHRTADSLYQEEEWRPAQAAESLATADVGLDTTENAVPAPEPLTDLQAQSGEPTELADTEISTANEPVEDSPPPRPPKWNENPIVRFAAVGGFLGIVFGACLIGLAWLFGPPNGPYDLGNSFSTSVGLKGHLFTKWDDDKLQYRLSFEPNDPSLHSAFAFAISNPPRPLSIAIQLKDAMGFVLCTRDIALKYDPTTAATADPSAQSGKIDGGKPGSTPVQPADTSQLIAAEKQREQGKDLFQPLIGSDGQIASLNAQGQIPCSDKAYSKVVGWGFTPNFPSLTEQSELMKQQAQKQADEARQAAARKRGPQKPADKTLSFSIEGDDSIMGYDPTAGVLETGTGESFYVEKDATVGSLAAWQAFPIRIHYRCDQTSFCTLTQTGSGAVLHARRRR